MSFVTRAYNSFDLDADRGVIIKKSNNERLNDEIGYYRSLPDPLRIHFPRYLGAEKIGDEYRLSLELYKYKNLGEYFFNPAPYEPAHLTKFWETVAINLSTALSDFSASTKIPGSSEYRRAMFITKTENEHEALLKLPFFSQMAEHDDIVLDGTRLLGFKKLWPLVLPKLEAMCDNSDFGVIHGDMCFSNILCGGDSRGVVLRFIDMRGSFGDKGVHGDPIYDYAKLAHSTDGGYEHYIYDMFRVISNETLREFELQRFSHHTLKRIHDVFKANLYMDKLEKANLVQGTIFIGMCARHYDSLERQKAMYLTGLRILNEAINE